MEVKYNHAIAHLAGWAGAICDSTGFFQHYGECWNDSLQMILLYTDGIKELTQPILFNTEITQEWVESRVSDDAKGTILPRYMYYYLRALQRRFKRHYSTEVAVRRLKATCDLDDDEMRKAKLGIELFYRRRGANAVQSAIYGSFLPNANKLNIKKYSKDPNRGRTQLQVDDLLSIILKILGIESNFIHNVQPSKQDFYSQAFFSPEPFPETLRAVRIQDGNHAAAFYTCGGTHYYYEDNLGPMPFRWDKFLKASTYEGIEAFLLSYNPALVHNLATMGKNNVLSPKVQDALKREVAFLPMTGSFSLVYAKLREGDFYHSYYPFIRIKNDQNEVRFYTLSPVTDAPRFYTGAEIEYTERPRGSGVLFNPIYASSDAPIANTNHRFEPSEIRIRERRGNRNRNYAGEVKKMAAIKKTFNPNNYLTRKNSNRRNNSTKKSNNQNRI